MSYNLLMSSSLDQMAGQPDVHQASDYHCDSKYPAGGQEREDQGNFTNHLRGHETGGWAGGCSN